MSEPTETSQPKGESLAVIDIGANAVRMVVAQALPDGRIEHLDETRRAVRLGQDTFASRRLGQKTMNAAIAILRDFRRIIDGYGVKHIRTVATSSVREAANADAFLDRVFMATNLEVEVLDPSEEIRLTVGAVRGALEGTPLQAAKSLVVDVGGGSALLAVLQKGQIQNAGSYQLGSIRLQEMLSTSQEPPTRSAELLRHQIANSVAAIHSSLPLQSIKSLIAVGGDARLAAQQVGTHDIAGGPATIGIREFDSFVARCEVHTAEELAKTYHVPFADAETLVPALLVYQILLHHTQARKMVVPSVSMRDGLLMDLVRSAGGQDDPELVASILQSAGAIGEKYHVDVAHSAHVAELAGRLFDSLQDLHGLKLRQRLLLRVAALLHEVGGFVSSRAHHKHSYYLVVNSEIFGLGREETQIVALVARYHRRGLPQPAHQEFMAAPRESRMIVSKLAAILRVADALDRGHAQQIRDVAFERQDDDFIIYAGGMPDLALERRALATKADLFEDIYGLKVRLEEAQREPLASQNGAAGV